MRRPSNLGGAAVPQILFQPKASEHIAPETVAACMLPPIGSAERENLFITGRCRLERRVPQSRSSLRLQALVAKHKMNPSSGGNLAAASSIKSLATDVHVAELARAVKAGDASSVDQWASVCAQTDGALDCRCAAHVGSRTSTLCATPLWLAVYRHCSGLPQSRELVHLLLKAGASPNCVAQPCGGYTLCEVGGQSALHLAVSRGSLEIAQRLLSLRAAVDAPVCFALLAEEDEPEWNEAREAFEGTRRLLSPSLIFSHPTLALSRPLFSPSLVFPHPTLALSHPLSHRLVSQAGWPA